MQRKWLLVIGVISVVLTIGLILSGVTIWKRDRTIDAMFDSLERQRVREQKFGPSSPMHAGDVTVAMERLTKNGEQVQPDFWLTTPGGWKNPNAYQAVERLAGKIDLGPLHKFSWAVLSDGKGLDRINQPEVEYAAVLTKLEATDFECTLYARWWSNEDSLAGYVEPVVHSENERIGLQVVSVNCYRPADQNRSRDLSVIINIQLRVVYRGRLADPGRDATVPVRIEIERGK